MENIFYSCLLCGKYLKANYLSIAQELIGHKCADKFDLVQFQSGIDMLQEQLKSKKPTKPPPPPPKMPSALLHTATKSTITFSRGNKG